MSYLTAIISTICCLLWVSTSEAEKIYVVERERGALAVIDEQKKSYEIAGLGNLNHATLKFYGKFAYVISRDGYFSKIDTTTDTVVKKVAVGESGIGFVSCGNFIGVANYDPRDVVFLDLNLEVVKKFDTESRNVGIKCADNYFMYALMDRDEIWIHNADKNFEKIKTIKTTGNLPFDALLSDDTYMVGFFKGGTGALSLKDFQYNEYIIKAGTEVVYKIPHFGTWGIHHRKAYIPAVGDKKLMLYDINNFQHLGFIELIGLPVFVVVSPDGKYIAVNYSGDMDNYITIIELAGQKVIKNIEAGRRIMHMRFSKNSSTLYVSSYFENMIKSIDMKSMELKPLYEVPSPSGIFIY